MIDIETIQEPLKEFLPKQRWYAGGKEPPNEVEIEDHETLRKDWPAMVQTVVTVDAGDEVDRYHVLVGLRPFGEHAQFLEGVEEGVIGSVETNSGSAYAYDALKDPELSKALFEHIAPQLGEVKQVRAINTEQSNTSLVLDERFIMKVYRKLIVGENPDVIVNKTLWQSGFRHIPEPIADWTFDRTSYAVIRGFLSGGSEAWSLALTSLRDLFVAHGNPAMAGGDFGHEVGRLGEMTAELHLKLMDAFGSEPADPKAWAEAMHAQLARLEHPDVNKKPIRQAFDALNELVEAGPLIRVHGDYHLGQVMRTDEGWFVLDFEGEPARRASERVNFSSPLKDVSGMLRSLHYAAYAARISHDQSLDSLATAWEERNRQAFLEGYVPAAHAAGLIPDDVKSFETLLKAFELDKAVYEVFYEQSYRPDWIEIPLTGIQRLTQEAS
jgi:maltokinase